MSDVIHVAVAVIVDGDGRVCLSLRHKDSHQGGLWEFPGGKVENGESIEHALAREIEEELGIIIDGSRPLITIEHAYPDRRVCLHVRRSLSYSGEARGLEGQKVRWQPVSELATLDFPAANQAIIKAVQLPERYLITGKFDNQEDFLSRLSKSLQNDIRLVQLRLKQGDLETASDAQWLLEQTSVMCQQHDAMLMLNIAEPYLSGMQLSEISYSGFHADSRKLMQLSDDITGSPAGKLSASCHSIEELERAVQLGADFAVLSPVQKTNSHPDMKPLGWQSFADMISGIPIPVFALGGVSESDIETAWSYGGQGVAAISAYWNS